MKQLLYNAADIRNELYELRNELQRGKNQHLHAFAQEGGCNKSSCGKCHPCEWWDDQISGVDRAIRHFGGRPRR